MEIKRRAASSLMESGGLLFATLLPAWPAASVGNPATSVAGSGVTLRSVSVDLPTGGGAELHRLPFRRHDPKPAGDAERRLGEGGQQDADDF